MQKKNFSFLSWNDSISYHARASITFLSLHSKAHVMTWHMMATNKISPQKSCCHYVLWTCNCFKEMNFKAHNLYVSGQWNTNKAGSGKKKWGYGTCHFFLIPFPFLVFLFPPFIFPSPSFPSLPHMYAFPITGLPWGSLSSPVRAEAGQQTLSSAFPVENHVPCDSATA